VQQALGKAGRLEVLRRILLQADGALAATPWLEEFYRAIAAQPEEPEASLRIRFVPTPYPVDGDSWDLSRPVPERSGILIGTREFDVPSRNHALAVPAMIPLANELRVPLWVVNRDGRRGAARLKEMQALCPELRVVEGSRPYPEYLRMVAERRLVFQLDQSQVPGQVAGDCLLAGVPCVGGNGAVESLAFPDFTGGPGDISRLQGVARRLLNDEDFYAEAQNAARQAARQKLAFEPVARSLEDFFGALPTRRS
jgi:hypothetical protein